MEVSGSSSSFHLADGRMEAILISTLKSQARSCGVLAGAELLITHRNPQCLQQLFSTRAAQWNHLWNSIKYCFLAPPSPEILNSLG